MKEKTSIVKEAYSILCGLQGFLKKGQWMSGRYQYNDNVP